MAEIAVKLVLGKLADAVIQEALFLYGVGDKVKWVQRELTWIQSFLKDADSRRHRDERVKLWVNEVKEVSYLIDDTLDKFLLDVSKDNGHENLRQTLKRIGKLPMKMIAKHKLGTEIAKIQQRIHQISESSTKYRIEGLIDCSTTTSCNLPMRLFVIPDIDKTTVVGFEVDKRTMVNKLTDANVTRRSVISIVGAGGSGKTTLTKEVYKSDEVKRHFAIRLWLTISHEYKLIDIIIKMLEGIGRANLEMRQKGEEHLITELYNSLRETRYIMVLDDVWSSDLWTQLEVATPDSTNGSRVLITTRFIKIAEEADATSKPHEIGALNEEESQQLLLKKIFPNQYSNECPQHLLPMIPQFAKKCGGWPLALVVLAGILSRKIPNHNTWDEVIQNIDWHTEGRRCMGVLSTSYEDLPNYLKPCFMYLAIFPEDHLIKATSLIRLWVAEGFILHDTSKPMEDIAEGYLEELVQRCLVQVSRRSARGKIKYCRIHDLIRELAIQKAKEDNFLTVFSRNDAHLSNNSSARRVALNIRGDMSLDHACTNLRSLNYFGDGIPSCNRFGMLQVLNIQPDHFDGVVKDSNRKYRIRNNGVEHILSFFNDETKWLKTLTTLRYFGFETGIFEPAKSTQMPSSSCYGAFFKLSCLTHMKNLQTVDIRDLCRREGELPLSFWENKLLRHVIFTPCLWCETTPEGPPSSADLKNLQTLTGVTARKEWDTKLPQFPHLRKLRMIVPDSGDVDSIANSLSNLQDLCSLSLVNKGHSPLTFPCSTSALKIHERVYSLYLKGGIWPKQEVAGYDSMFVPHLVKLTLVWFNYAEDPMIQLEKLPNLAILNLYGWMTTDEKKMICSRSGFGRLQRLLLSVKDLDEWEIEDGAMPMLNQLVLTCCWTLTTVPDLQFLINLRELKVTNCGFKFLKVTYFEDGSCLQEDHQWKIKHIPSITIY